MRTQTAHSTWTNSWPSSGHRVCKQQLRVVKSAAMAPRVLAGRGVLYVLLSSGVSDVVPCSVAPGAWAVAPWRLGTAAYTVAARKS